MKITIVVHDDNNKGYRAVFDGEGNKLQGSDEVLDMVLGALVRSTAPAAEPTPADPDDSEE